MSNRRGFFRSMFVGAASVAVARVAPAVQQTQVLEVEPVFPKPNLVRYTHEEAFTMCCTVYAPVGASWNDEPFK